MALQKQLGQATPPSANTAVSIYSPPANTQATNITLIVTNVSGADRTFRVFQDDNGTTYDVTTALYYNYPILADQTLVLLIPPMSVDAGNLAASSSANSAVTFTASGIEITDPLHKILGQRFDNNTNANEIYTVPADTVVTNLRLVVSNSSGSAQTFNVFQDDQGDAAGTGNTIFYTESIPAASRKEVNLLPMNTSGGKIYVQSSAVSGLCFTLSGTEQ